MNCGDSYKHFFENQIVRIMTNLYRRSDNVGKIVKVIAIWKESKTFDKNIMDSIEVYIFYYILLFIIYYLIGCISSHIK